MFPSPWPPRDGNATEGPEAVAAEPGILLTGPPPPRGWGGRLTPVPPCPREGQGPPTGEPGDTAWLGDLALQLQLQHVQGSVQNENVGFLLTTA